MIRNLFGWGEKPAELKAEQGPLGVAVGGAILIDTLGLQADTMEAAPAMPIFNGGTMIVAAYGEARLDAATMLSRYYDEEHRMLQVLSPSGKPGDAAMDVSFYQPWDSVIPAGPVAWAEWRGPNGAIGQARYDADGILFDRFWGEGSEVADLVEFVEEIDDGETKRSIHQTCMLYARALGSRQEMLLINIERDLADQDRRQGASIEFIIGYGLGAGDVRRV